MMESSPGWRDPIPLDGVSSQPEISVIVAGPVHPAAMGRCLSALRKQTYPADRFEVVVVQSNGPGYIMPDAEQAASYHLRVLAVGGCDRAVALNRGAAAAAGRLCLFLADAGLAHKNLVEAHVQAHRDAPDVIAAGRVDWQVPSDAAPFARFAAEQLRARFAPSGRATPDKLYFAADYRNLSVCRDLFLAAGGFDADLRSDTGLEFAYRLGQQGHACVVVPGAVVQQSAPKRAAHAIAGIVRAGHAAWQLYRRHTALLPDLKLGAFNSTSARALILRRLLLALPVRPRMLPAATARLANMRWGQQWHHFLRSYCYWYGVRHAVNDRDIWLRLIRPPVILMYHAVGRQGERPGRYLVPAGRFARQMAWLHRRCYPVLPLEALARYRVENRLPPARSIVLTFDDGYADNLTIAWPILRRHRFPATIFLVSRAVGGVNGWDNAGELAGRTLLSWSDIEKLQEGGITLGAHTRHHPALTEIPEDQLQEEVAGSRSDLIRQLGCQVELFAYPHGKHDARVQASVADAGYLCACCSYAGLNDPTVPQFALRRSEVRGTDTLLGFALLPWLGRARLRPRDPNARRG